MDLDINQEHIIYGGILLISSDDFCYAVSYGNAHFYISAYCEYGFGMTIAERIVNLESVKAHQNASHGSKRNKTFIDYSRNSPLSYESGEIPSYLKGSSINEEIWGKLVDCSVTSIQFKWEECPSNIALKIRILNEAYLSECEQHIPRLIPVDIEKNPELASRLLRDLANLFSILVKMRLLVILLIFLHFICQAQR